MNATEAAATFDHFGQAVSMRADGRVLADLTLYRVKTPSQSTGPWDDLAPIDAIPASETYIPMNPACATG